MIQKVRMNVLYSEEILNELKRLFLEEPSTELMNAVLQDKEVMDNFEMFQVLMSGDTFSKQIIAAQKYLSKVDQLLQKYPQVERMKLKKFLQISKKGSKVSNEVIEKVLENEDAIQDLKLVLGSDGLTKLGTEAMNRIEAVIKSESKKLKKRQTCLQS